MSPVPGELAALRAANAGLRQVFEAKDAEITVLHAQVEELRAQVEELAARVQANSKNSSRPPSSDGLGRPAPKSLRKKTGRGPGRPKGQPGMTLGLSDRPDHVIRHEPGGCGGCGAGLSAAEEAGVERRQVIDVPPVRPEITEHQIIARRCGCGTVTRGQAPEGVTAPVQYGPRISGIGAYLWHGQFLSKDRTCRALGEMFGVFASPGTIAAMARRIAGFLSPALAEITQALLACEVAHFDETGFRVAGKLAWVHSASSGKYVLVTVHSRRGTEAMDAAGVLPGFAGVACHDAWAPYDKYDQVAGHALCCAHLLRELIAVTGTGTPGDVIWARQAIDALLALKDAADAARAAGQHPIGTATVDLHSRYFRDAAAAGIALNAVRKGKLQRKRHALATRMRGRAADYLRFATDLRVPFDNNQAEQVIRMGKLRIKVSGCMRSMTGAEIFCAIRSYLATAARHGIGMLEALTRAAAGTPWIPGTT